MRMRPFEAIAAIAFAAVTVAACDQQQASNANAGGGGGTPAATASASPYDLSPDSNKKFLEDNVKKEGVKKTASGLQYRVIKAGSGKSPTVNDQVTVTYKGWLIDGTVFDQTEAGQSATFRWL